MKCLLWMMCALTLISVGHAQTRMDTMIGGYGFEKGFGHWLHDRKQGVYLHMAGECDGAHRRITLSTDYRAIMLNEGSLYEGLSEQRVEENTQYFLARHKRGQVKARTSKGVRIGMSEAEVLRILGKPTKTIWSKKFQARELIYSREIKWSKRQQEKRFATGVKYTNYYLFRNGKLFYIELSRDTVGGAC